MHDRQAIDLAWLTLLRAPALGPTALRAALAECPDVLALTHHSPQTLLALGLGDSAASHIARPPSARILDDLQWMARAGARLLPCTDSDYPAQLATLPDAPLALFVLGDSALLRQPQLAMVGSRHPTAAGQRLARQIAQQLCAAGLGITSGLARGIDAAAHAAALGCSGRTVAVCGTGLDQCYPAENQQLFARIREQGALVSEFPPGTAALPHHFPRRNRIISGLSRGVVVIEAAAGSGSLITAQRALDHGRELFAVPGSPLNPLAAGCLELIRAGAHLVRDATDILGEISISIEGNILLNQQLAMSLPATGKGPALDKDYEMLLDALGFEPASIDDLINRTGLAAGSVASMMLILELDGRVESRPGALYNRVS
ncbi:MAG: DNA-processing protein DprA [Steroidobacteraceae bacterium]